MQNLKGKCTYHILGDTLQRNQRDQRISNRVMPYPPPTQLRQAHNRQALGPELNLSRPHQSVPTPPLFTKPPPVKMPNHMAEQPQSNNKSTNLVTNQNSIEQLLLMIQNPNSGFRLTVEAGDLFAKPRGSMAHCISQDFMLSSGIAVLFRQRFPRIMDLQRFGTDIGEVAILARGDKQFVYNLVTKATYHDLPTYNNLAMSLKAMCNHAVQCGIKEISMPMIGCGKDRLDRAQVLKLLENTFTDHNIHIKIFEVGTQKASKVPVVPQPGQSSSNVLYPVPPPKIGQNPDTQVDVSKKPSLLVNKVFEPKKQLIPCKCYNTFVSRLSISCVAKPLGLLVKFNAQYYLHDLISASS